MIEKINRMIEKYKIGLEGSRLLFDSSTMYLIHEGILSDLEELKKLAEKIDREE